VVRITQETVLNRKVLNLLLKVGISEGEMVNLIVLFFVYLIPKLLYCSTLIVLESFYRWPDIHDQPADSCDFEPDFNQTVPRKSSF
jgi:hypothetical protein